MSAKLPYLASPGNVPKALTAIRKAATPPRVSQDFVKTKLGIPGSSGDQVATLLKRIGFASSDGTPTDFYTRFRSQRSGVAMAEAVRHGYPELFELNEYAHECSDDELKDLIIQATGQASDARPVSLTLVTLRHLLNEADFDEDEEIQNVDPAMKQVEAEAWKPTSAPAIPQTQPNSIATGRSIGLNLGYTINLNLPDTKDIEVFNAIFKSLRENLLKSDEE